MLSIIYRHGTLLDNIMDPTTERRILENAAAALEHNTGLKVDKYDRKARKHRGDFHLALQTPSGKKLRNYWAEVKQTINNSVIAATALEAKQSKEKLVLITEYISQPQATKLRELDVSYFDTAGNAYFTGSDLYILVTGQKKKIVREKIPSLFRPPGMKLLFAFLTNRGLEEESYRSISSKIGVPTPTVGVFMGDLEKAGFLVKRGTGKRFIVRQDELFKRFVENYGESFRQTLNPVRFRSRKVDGRWWENVDISQFNACWGGETGGAALTKHLRPEVATIYADSLLPKFQAKYGLIREETGNIEIVRRFWKTGEIGNVAPPLIVYADLMATADRRNIETAELIYERYLADVAKATS
jgi:hypothetical protein